MEITKILLISICTVIFSSFLKPQRPEIAVLLTLLAGAMVIYLILPYAAAAVNEARLAAIKLNINSEYFKALLKIVGISYIVQYGAEICRDAGEGALSTKIEMAGKLILLYITLPVVNSLFDTVVKIVP